MQKNNTIKDGNGTPVYYTTADLTGIYDNNTLVGDASIEESSYGFQDVRTDSSGKLYMYLPASEAVKAPLAVWNLPERLRQVKMRMYWSVNRLLLIIKGKS